MAPLETRTLVILRHAHRNKTFGKEADNGISATGRRQAKAIARFYVEMFGKTKPVIYSSPKVRCIETVQPIAKKLRVPVGTLDSLNESTTDAELRERTRSFDALWRSGSEKWVLVCSHGDWIPAFLKRITGVEIDLDKGGWIQIELANGQPRLRWVLEHFDFL